MVVWDAIHNQIQTGSFRYVHNTIGTNYRMTEMQAAMAASSLRSCRIGSAKKSCAGISLGCSKVFGASYR